jgi:hypothetical protein
MSSSSDHGVLFTSSFRYPDRTLVWSKMALLEDRLELSGWGWRGRHHRVLPLEDIVGVQWWTGKGSANLRIRLKERAHVKLFVEAAGLWKHRIQARAPRLNAPLLHENEEAPAASEGAERQPEAEAQKKKEEPSAASNEKGGAPGPPSPQLHVAQKPPVEEGTEPPRAAVAPQSSDASTGAAAKTGAEDPQHRQALTQSYAAASGAPLLATPTWHAEEVALLALCGVLCGADDLEALEVFARSRSSRVRELLRLSGRGSSSADRRRRPLAPQLLSHFLESIRPVAFRQHLACWQQRLAVHVSATGDGAPPRRSASSLEVDGSADPGSADRNGESVTLDGVEVNASDDYLMIRADGPSRAARNVIEALAAFEVDGRDVAAVLRPPVQRATGRLPRYARPHRLANALSERGARFLVALNEGDALEEEVADWAAPANAEAIAEAAAQTQKKRCCWAAGVRESTLNRTGGWPAASVGAVVEEAAGDDRVCRQSYLGNGAADATAILRQTRCFPMGQAREADPQELSWMMSVAPLEESGDGYCTENFNHLREAARTLIERESGASASLHQRRQQAGWDEGYLLSVLEHPLETPAAETDAAETDEPVEQESQAGGQQDNGGHIRNLRNVL